MSREVKFVDLSILIPISNESEILKSSVERLIGQVGRTFGRIKYEAILVENGSSDKTLDIAKDLTGTYSQVRVITIATRGYGKALKSGLLKSKGKYTAIFNIDYWDIGFIKKALIFSKQNNLVIVVGSKMMAGSVDRRPFSRKILTRSFNWFLSAAFGFRGTDTHGMKLVRTRDILPVVKACITEREVFDTELLLRAQLRDLKIGEIPVECIEIRKTKYHVIKRIPRTLKDLFVIYSKLHAKSHN